jgi:hypothetical protein
MVTFASYLKTNFDNNIKYLFCKSINKNKSFCIKYRQLMMILNFVMFYQQLEEDQALFLYIFVKLLL